MTDRIQEEGIVRYVKDGYAYLKTEDNASCGHCSAKSVCSSASFVSNNSVSDNSDYSIRILNKDNLKAGDKVRIELSSQKLLLGTVLIYVLPLLFLLILAGIGKVLGGELVSILMGVSGLFLGFFIIRKFVSKKEVACQFDLDVERVL